MPAAKETWKSTSTIEKKPWGETKVWQTFGSIHGKIITIHEGQRTSLKYHKLKNEVFFVLHGKVRVIHGNSKTILNSEKNPYKMSTLGEGDVFTVQSECPYRFEAIEESQIIEVGDRYDDNPTRLEDDYGRSQKE